MGFEVYVQWFGGSAESRIPVAAVRALFPIVEAESEPTLWRVRYDASNSCEIGITALESDVDKLESLYVDRPCVHPGLWHALSSLLRMGRVVIFWPGGPPVVADAATGATLPREMLGSLGPPRTIQSGEELRLLVNES